MTQGVDFHETRASSRTCVNNSYTEFHENPTNCLVAVTASHKDMI
jgi:hypothetical protein